MKFYNFIAINSYQKIIIIITKIIFEKIEESPQKKLLVSCHQKKDKSQVSKIVCPSLDSSSPIFFPKIENLSEK